MLLCMAETSSPFLIQSLTVWCHGVSSVVYFSLQEFYGFRQLNENFLQV